MTECTPGYDDKITITPKPGEPNYTIQPKPYEVETNGLVTEDCQTILNEDGSQLLMQVG